MKEENHIFTHILVFGCARFCRWIGLWWRHRSTLWVVLDWRFLDWFFIHLYSLLLKNGFMYDGSQHLDLVNWKISHQWLYMIVHVVVLYMFYHWKTMKGKTQESCDLYKYHWKLPVNTGTKNSFLLRKSLSLGPAPSLTRFYKYRITQPRSWACQWETWMRVGW